MRYNIKKLANSIFSRLVLTFLIILIPIYGLAIYIFNWGLYTVNSEISKSTIAQVNSYLNGLEKEIERIKILQYDCLNDDYLNKLAIRYEIMSDYEKTESMIRVQQRLVTIKNSSAYIKNVSVHVPLIGKTISSNTGVDSIDTERFTEIRVPKGLKGAQIIGYKGGMYLSTVQKNNLSKPLFLIEIELNHEAFKQALTQFTTYEGSTSILVSLIDNGIISNRNAADSIIQTKSILSNLEKEEVSGTEFVKVNDKKYYIVHAKSDYLNMILLKYIPQQFILQPIKNFNVWVWVFSIVVIMIIIVYSLSTYKFMHKPLIELVKSFQRVENGDLQVVIEHDLDDEFGYLYKRFNDMVRNLKMLIDQVYNQKILMQKAELKHLQSQINPHFLYNSFFMINTMATIGDENLIPFTKYLGEYFRFVTRNSSEFISLAEEINHARVYTELQLMRFSQRLEVNFEDYPGTYNDLKVPRLILQPIIENAFEHGIERKMSNSILLIYFVETEQVLDIIVEDNGNNITDAGIEEMQKRLESDDDETEITGIINIHRRLKLIFGEKSGIVVSRSQFGGLKVIVRIIIPGGDENVQITDC